MLMSELELFTQLFLHFERSLSSLIPFCTRGGSDAFPEEAVSKVQRVASQAEQGLGGTGEPS